MVAVNLSLQCLLLLKIPYGKIYGTQVYGASCIGPVK
jgi:hypothetical protein